MRTKAKKIMALSCSLMLFLTGCKDPSPVSQESETASTETSSTEADTSQPEPVSEETGSITEPQKEVSISYEFTGGDAAKAGYAEGIVSLTSSESASYHLYWSDDSGALLGYYEIAALDVEAGQTADFSFAYHTAIPADATKIIAVDASTASEYPSVSDAAAVFDIPADKQLAFTSSDALYTFNSFSDIHIDEEHFGETPAFWWENSEAHWKQALEYAVNLNVDFIVSSGDQITNANLDNLAKEWQAYQLILSQSDYVKPIYESLPPTASCVSPLLICIRL